MFPIKVNGIFFQWIATIIGCILTFSYGILLGISCSQIKDYRILEVTPLSAPINNNDANWITLYLSIGAITGSIISGFSATILGRKPTLICSGILQITSWFCIAFGTNVLHIHISRFIAGLCVGGTFVVLPVYISEITENKFRGSLISHIIFFENLGIIFGLTIVEQIHYDYIPLIGVAFSTAFTLSFPFIQESPYFYLTKNEIKLLEKSLRWFRGIRTVNDRCKQDFLNEIEKFKGIKGNLKFTKTNKYGCNCREIKIFILGLILIINTQFSKYLTILNQSGYVLEEIVYLQNDTMNIIFIAIQMIGSFFAVLICDRISRKILISISSFGISLSSLILGTLIFVEKIHIVETLKWMAIVCLCTILFLINISLYPLTFVLMTEIFPYKKKILSISVFMTYHWIGIFLLELYSDFIRNILSISILLWVFAGFCFFEALTIILVLPETRRKSFEEIRNTARASVFITHK